MVTLKFFKSILRLFFNGGFDAPLPFYSTHQRVMTPKLYSARWCEVNNGRSCLPDIIPFSLSNSARAYVVNIKLGGLSGVND
jgi:hypothetical protein